jgi:hypothetical protein
MAVPGKYALLVGPAAVPATGRRVVAGPRLTHGCVYLLMPRVGASATCQHDDRRRVASRGSAASPCRQARKRRWPAWSS